MGIEAKLEPPAGLGGFIFYIKSKSLYAWQVVGIEAKLEPPAGLGGFIFYIKSKSLYAWQVPGIEAFRFYIKNKSSKPPPPSRGSTARRPPELPGIGAFRFYIKNKTSRPLWLPLWLEAITAVRRARD